MRNQDCARGAGFAAQVRRALARTAALLHQSLQPGLKALQAGDPFLREDRLERQYGECDAGDRKNAPFGLPVDRTSFPSPTCAVAASISGAFADICRTSFLLSPAHHGRSQDVRSQTQANRIRPTGQHAGSDRRRKAGQKNRGPALS
jgi:hypothetical protein